MGTRHCVPSAYGWLVCDNILKTPLGVEPNINGLAEIQ